ncbi:MAG: D-2-hydroxyacid dehydrogenase [Ruminococcaceae bacterium]|nr:D-2-hydroxyacid dehydrogenase [Oscillospiraceae bacterium]
MKLVILDGYTENPGDLSWDWLKDLVDEYTVYDKTPENLIVERAKDADILVTNKTPLTRETLSSLKKLRYISTLATGYNVIDIEAATELGITVSNIPAYSTDGVAQLVFALLLEMVNSVAVHNDSVKKGEWASSEHFCYWKTPLTELSGKIFGIIGFGKIGSAVAAIANAFKMKVIAYSPNTRSYDGFGSVNFLSLEEVIAASDVISLHCPLTESTKGLVNMDFIRKMKKGAYIINTSRGPVLNEADVRKALDEGLLAGVGADVLSTEPPASDNPLTSTDKTVITPHIAWASLEARTRLMNIFKSNVEGFVNGKPVNCVN